MSCEKNANKISSANLSAGIARTVSKSAYVRALKRNAERTRAMLKSIRRFLAGTPSETTAVTELKPSERIAPITPPAGKTCADCGASAAKPGRWYRLNGEVYCADCAPKAAKEAGVSLAIPLRKLKSGQNATNTARITTGGAATFRTPSTTDGKPVTLSRDVTVVKAKVPKSVDLATGKSAKIDVDAYRLLTREGRDTGLALTPSLRVTDGRIRVDTNAWRITHSPSGRDVTPQDFSSPTAAFGLGQLLAQFNWNRPFSTFSRRELATIRATLNAYQNADTRLRQIETPASQKSNPLDKPLHDKLVVDSSGEVVRVFDDLGETLVVSDVLGQSYKVPRIEVRIPDEEDFAHTDLAFPLDDEALLNENACSQCGRSVGDNTSLKWYRLQGKTMCEHCARTFGPDMNLSLPDTIL